MKVEALSREGLNSDFARGVGQAAVAVEISNLDSRIKREEVCTTMRHGAKLGAALTIEALRRAGVTIHIDDIEEATRMAIEMNQVDNRGDD